MKTNRKIKKPKRTSLKMFTFVIVLMAGLTFAFFLYAIRLVLFSETAAGESVPAFQTAAPQITAQAKTAEENIPSKEAEESTDEPPTETPTPSPSPTPQPSPTPIPDSTLVFAGDILLDGSVRRTIEADGIETVFPEESRAPFIAADIAMANVETSISLRGSPMPDKEYTYRSDPEHALLLKDMGLDIVSVANNHTIDYGRDAFADTLDFFKAQKIAYVGGGMDKEEAKRWQTFELNGKKYAYLAASRVIPVVDWYAGKNLSGLFGAYDPTELNEQIALAKESHDYVIVYLHWGVERNPVPEDWQRNQARGHILSGADMVIGSHPHILQGFEFFNGKLIAYSLGNFIFSDAAKDTGALEVTVSPEGEFTYRFLPYEIINRRTVPINDADKRESLRASLNGISFGAEVNKQFEITAQFSYP
ncbi:MAG: CapA family protein [Clostridiales bacterium]|jgi:poly-gamma-glutamate synthesis protein (capsule biosynthesis protein)|nr:CapA family protein [Clostridiales bacterium]